MTTKRQASSRARNARCRTVQSVVDHKVCCGCGACAAVCPVNCIEFVYGERYNYPRIDADRCTRCGLCLEVCPSAFLLRGTDPGFTDRPQESSLGCYLVHSRDDQIRHYGASGGGITGLLDHLMRKGDIDGAIVARTLPDRPLVSQTFIARDRDSLLSAQGSRYAPVSNCTALREVLEQPGRYAIVGTPCMLQATTRAQELRAPLRERIVFKVGLVCAGMASRLSTKAFLQRYGVELSDIREIRYRGEGWPGFFRAYGEDGVLLRRPLLGDELEYLVPGDHYLRCWNCLDHWGYFSDIVVSDPWTQDMVEHERKGWTAIMVRTEQGKEFLSSAIGAGDLTAKDISVQDMLDYNKHLVVREGHPRHGWMAAYQLLFFWRLRFLGTVLASIVRKKRVGIKTTINARRTDNYYF